MARMAEARSGAVTGIPVRFPPSILWQMAGMVLGLRVQGLGPGRS